jgi:hypothetical protein
MSPENLDSETLDHYWRFVRGDLMASSFESWLYSNPKLENMIGENAYLEAISVDFRNPKTVAVFKAKMRKWLPAPAECSCHRIPDRGFIDPCEWSSDWLDFVEREIDGLFWLNRAICKKCGTMWLIAVDTLIYDVLLLARNLEGAWPDVQSYRGLLNATRKTGNWFQYVDPMNSMELATAIERLAKETPGITLSELVELLPIDRDVARHHAVVVARNHGLRIDLEE